MTQDDWQAVKVRLVRCKNTWDRPYFACYDSATVPVKMCGPETVPYPIYMQEFYKKTLLALIALLVADALLAFFFVYRAFPTQTLSAKRWLRLACWNVFRGGIVSGLARDAA